MREIDAIDKKILRSLQENGRMSNLSLAKSVDLTPTPCLERVKRLERDGLITGYTASLDPAKLGLGLLIIVHISLNHGAPGVFDRFTAEVKAIPQVIECLMVTGDFDYILKIRCADMHDYRMVLSEQLSAIDGVAKTSTFVVIEEPITDGRLPIL